MKPSALTIPRSVRALCWALFAARDRFEGFTHDGIRRLLGIGSKDGTRALVRRAEGARMVRVAYVDGKRGKRPVVQLTVRGHNALEGLLNRE